MNSNYRATESRFIKSCNDFISGGKQAMSFMITCPNCGRRDIHEFRFGAEVRDKIPNEATIDKKQHYEMIHERTNAAGPQKELWFHRDGCEAWFTVWRDTRDDLEIPAPREKA
jgi:sarcosine oxidase subunit delta